MADLFSVLYNVISPIFLIVGVAWVADRRIGLDPKPLSRALIYIFSPCLVLDSLVHSDMGGDEMASLVAVALLASIITALVAWGVSRAWRFDQRLESAFMLGAVLINAGNYGLPLNRLAFGPEGEARAMIYFIATYMISNSLGVFLAARGSRSTWEAVRTVFFIPLPYAVIGGLLLNVTDIALPGPVNEAVGLLAQASIPGMIVVLGIQLSRARFAGRIAPMIAAGGVRLLVSPLIALGLVLLFGLTGVSKQVAIVEAAMPTAVMSSVLATEFGADSDFVTGVVLLTTLASIATLSVLLLLVGWSG
ncbi:MAG TPA: AEC family transporter [Aggregatilinea sp.]|uniref:AEC family transporter n=1 Tax=Aggregatilinea sp. TaxID=2806333 RepID=UPI002CFCA6D9|nr:AEC family transporter [Aggregatilinea sp.]HML21648.1 AEC family transporter [Aggregatilinea sp.]